MPSEQNKLKTRALYPACCFCILLQYLHREGSCSSMHEAIDNLYLHVVLGIGCVHEQASSGCG